MLFGGPAGANSLNTSQEAKLALTDAATFDQFGESVAVSQDTLVVGARFNDSNGGRSGSAYVYIRSGSKWVQQAKLTAKDGTDGDLFGTAVAIAGDRIIVGAPNDDDSAGSSGSAYVFSRSGRSWIQEAKLTANDPSISARFGGSVAIDADSVAIGASGDSDGGTAAGSAYVFTREGTTWTQQAELKATDAAEFDAFGVSVAIAQDTVAVGAQNHDDGGLDSGSAYVFIRSGTQWTQQAKLAAADAAADDTFGRRLSIAGQSIVVGAHFSGNTESESGAAYIFTRNEGTWSQEAKLTAQDAAAGDVFGRSVSISGDTVVVGAPLNDDAGSSSGSGYVFTRSEGSWTQQTKLSAAAAAAGDQFGVGITVDGDTIVVGAPRDDDSGSAVFFDRSESVWSESITIKAGDPAAFDEFGTSVAISGDTMVVGAPFDDDLGPSSGSVLVFVRTGTTWEKQAKLDSQEDAAFNFFGSSVAISGDRIVIGAPGDDDDETGASSSGSAYIFVRNAGKWTNEAKLTVSDPAALAGFGTTVAIDGTSAVIGAPFDDDAGFASGSAYVFTRTGATWATQTKLTAEDASPGDQFGTSVAISDGTVVVGAPDDDDAGPDSGSAYIFTREQGGWTKQAKLAAQDAAMDDEFGTSVAISEDTAVIGAPQHDDDNPNSGSAYIYTRAGTSWLQKSELTATEAGAFDFFGRSVAVFQQLVVVGAPLQERASTGSAYLFTGTESTWSQQATLKPDDTALGDQFGISVAISGNTIVAGSAFDNEAGPDSGSAYVFVTREKPPDPPVVPNPPVVPKPPTPQPIAPKVGYWMLESDGTVYEFGDSSPFDAVPVSAGVTTIGFDRSDDGSGLWILDNRGKVHVRGTAIHKGDVDVANLTSTDRLTSISVTPSGQGYWVFTELGRVFNFGDAISFGDLPTLGVIPNGPVIASAATPSGKGYYMLGSDGGVFAFGDASFIGSIPQVLPAGTLACPIVGLVPTPSGGGYWMVACDGGVFAFGDANFVGSIPGVLAKGTQLNSPINGLVPYGAGYLMVASDGGVFTFSDLAFLGSLGNNPPNTPIVAITAFAT